VDTAVAAIIAVVGTLLGSALTYLFQQKATAYVATLGTQERARQERLDAFASFGGSAVRCRVASLDVWHRQDDGSSEDVQRTARAEFYRMRAELVDAELRVQLVSSRKDLHVLMAEVIGTATKTASAASAAERNDLNENAKAALARFVQAAAKELRHQSGRP
jgi:hypothetical protein